MTKIEEILCTKFFVEPSKLTDNEDGICAKLEYEVHRSQHLPSRLINGMKEYAEFYARRVVSEIYNLGLPGETHNSVYFPDERIFFSTSKLPEHE